MTLAAKQNVGNRPARWLSAALVFLSAMGATRAEGPPLAWQPGDASGAEGAGFTISMRAAPTTLVAEDALTLTIRIRATGAWQHAPRRLPLGRMKEFKTFDVATSPSSEPDRTLSSGPAWEFDYRLRPLTAEVKKIPGIALRYYNPEIPVPERRWQTTFADPIPLTVKPRTTLTAEDFQGAKSSQNLPPAVYTFTRGAAVLGREEPFSLPGPIVIVLLLLLPPAASIGGCFLWRRLNPHALRPRRNSRAARQALKALGGLNGDSSAEKCAIILSVYLRQRIEFAPADLTPSDVAEHLKRAGYQPGIAMAGADFFRACDEAQFAKPEVHPTANDLPARAARLIQSLEEDRP
jgi:hypothetical protein